MAAVLRRRGSMQLTPADRRAPDIEFAAKVGQALLSQDHCTFFRCERPTSCVECAIAGAAAVPRRNGPPRAALRLRSAPASGTRAGVRAGPARAACDGRADAGRAPSRRPSRLVAVPGTRSLAARRQHGPAPAWPTCGWGRLGGVGRTWGRFGGGGGDLRAGCTSQRPRWQATSWTSSSTASGAPPPPRPIFGGLLEECAVPGLPGRQHCRLLANGGGGGRRRAAAGGSSQ